MEVPVEKVRARPAVHPRPVAFTDILSVADEKFFDAAIAQSNSLDEAAGGGLNTHYRWQLL